MCHICVKENPKILFLIFSYQTSILIIILDTTMIDTALMRACFEGFRLKHHSKINFESIKHQLKKPTKNI